MINLCWCSKNKYKRYINMDILFYGIGDIGEINKGGEKIIKLIDEDQKKSPSQIKFLNIMGDNFYPKGVIDKNDPSFKKMDKLLSTTSIPKHIVLGNHDWAGNPKAQLEYKSTHWKIDNFYYKKSFKGENYSLDVFYIDTQILYPGKDKTNPWEYFKEKIRSVFNKDHVIVKKNQLEWLEKSLKESNATWKVVIGHYHLKSSGIYSVYNEFRNVVFPLFKKYNVDMYFCGHEHDMQHFCLKEDDYILNQFVCGSGSNTRHIRRNEGQIFAVSEVGFYKCLISGNKALVTFINVNGKEIYKANINKEK